MSGRVLHREGKHTDWKSSEKCILVIKILSRSTSSHQQHAHVLWEVMITSTLSHRRTQTITDDPTSSRLHASGINSQLPALYWCHQLFPVSWCSIRWLPLMTGDVTRAMRNTLREPSKDDIGDYLDWGRHWGRHILVCHGALTQQYVVFFTNEFHRSSLVFH